MQKIIVSIEDDKDLAEYIQKVLKDNGYVAHVAYDAPGGLKLVQSVSPDLVLLDLHLPSMDGETVLKELQTEYPQLPVIILTAENNPQKIVDSFKLGAQDYMIKPFAPEELVARIRTRVHSTNEKNQVLQIADLEMNVGSHVVKRGKRPIELTPQEFKLLNFLMKHPNQVLSRESILSHIWSTSPDIETRVVDVYIGYLRKKIDSDAPTPIIHSVRGFGYMLKDSN